MDKIKDSLKSVFEIDRDEIDVFCSKFHQVTLQKDEVFIEEGKPCEKVGLIEKGMMVCIYHKEGNEVIEEFAFENGFITNYYSFLTGLSSEKEIRCLEDCTVWVISKHELEKLGEKYAFIERMARIINEKLFLRNHERLKSLLLDSATDRYLKLFSDRPDLAQRIPQYLIASYLNVQPETVSRIRKKLLTGDFIDPCQ